MEKSILESMTTEELRSSFLDACVGLQGHCAEFLEVAQSLARKGDAEATGTVKAVAEALKHHFTHLSGLAGPGTEIFEIFSGAEPEAAEILKHTLDDIASLLRVIDSITSSAIDGAGA